MTAYIDVKRDEILNHEFAVAAFDLLPGTIISRSEPRYLDHPTMHTICIDAQTHSSPDNNGRFLSHACGETANCRVVFDQHAKTFAIEITRKVAKGEALAFNYNCTEWDMHCPFDCACMTCVSAGKSNRVSGFKYLAADEQAALLEFASPYVQSMAVGRLFSNLLRCRM